MIWPTLWCPDEWGNFCLLVKFLWTSGYINGRNQDSLVDVMLWAVFSRDNLSLGIHVIISLKSNIYLNVLETMNSDDNTDFNSIPWRQWFLLVRLCGLSGLQHFLHCILWPMLKHREHLKDVLTKQEFRLLLRSCGVNIFITQKCWGSTRETCTKLGR